MVAFCGGGPGGRRFQTSPSAADKGRLSRSDRIVPLSLCGQESGARSAESPPRTRRAGSPRGRTPQRESRRTRHQRRLVRPRSRRSLARDLCGRCARQAASSHTSGGRDGERLFLAGDALAPEPVFYLRSQRYRGIDVVAGPITADSVIIQGCKRRRTLLALLIRRAEPVHLLSGCLLPFHRLFETFSSQLGSTFFD